MTPYPFIVLEGIDGAGKSTLARELASHLQLSGMPTTTFTTPPLPYSKIAKDVINTCSVRSRYYFFLSSIFQASNQIELILHRKAVVCDRYIYSTIAYHRAFGYNTLDTPANLGLLVPDFAFLLQIDDREHAVRLRSRRRLTAADEQTLSDPALRRRFAEEFSRFPLQEIDVTTSTLEELGAQLAALVISAALDRTKEECPCQQNDTFPK